MTWWPNSLYRCFVWKSLIAYTDILFENHLIVVYHVFICQYRGQETWDPEAVKSRSDNIPNTTILISTRLAYLTRGFLKPHIIFQVSQKKKKFPKTPREVFERIIDVRKCCSGRVGLARLAKNVPI